MRVLKVVAEGQVTSFRYPHFMQGIHPTFDMPPPATIYGHICSTLGEWFDPQGVKFALHFSFAGRFSDMEHVHVLTHAKGMLKASNYPKNLEGNINPFRRELLYRPRLVLYLNRPNWVKRFRSPRYAVVLGRSQDLFTYREVETVELQEADHFYLEHTLLPYNFTWRTGRGVAVLMPRFLTGATRRHPLFERYLVLHHRVHSRDLLRQGGETFSCWIDPTSPEIGGDQLGLVFHSWVEANTGEPSLA